MPAIDLTPLPPEEAIRHFRGKGYRVGFDWRDLWQQEHARAFTVAKAMRYDVLADIRAALDRAIAEGRTLSQFRRGLTPLLQAKGWWGRVRQADPLTGEIRAVQLGSPRRLRTIFDTNVRMAHAAGRWERIERVKRRRPYLRYSAVLDDRTRPEHAAWHGTVLPADDAWWDTHYPPNGWRCRCTVQQLSDRDLKRFGFAPTARPPAKKRRWRNSRTGRTELVPEGIDPGFAYNVGRAHMRGLAPPPLSGPLTTPAINPPAGLPMPPPRPAPASRLLPGGLDDAEYERRFLAEFGAAPGRPKVFTDVLGEPLVISEDLFRDAAGASKLRGSGRKRALLLLADAIRQPDEIWWVWEHHEARNRWLLRRRYFARFQVAGEEVPTLVAFDTSKDGWLGVTAFRPKEAGYLLRQRAGTLAWRRGGRGAE